LVQEPVAFAVTIPPAAIVATLVLDELQAAVPGYLLCCRSLQVPMAVICCFSPAFKVARSCNPLRPAMGAGRRWLRPAPPKIRPTAGPRSAAGNYALNASTGMSFFPNGDLAVPEAKLKRQRALIEQLALIVPKWA
jgi:hypothetical protein